MRTKDIKIKDILFFQELEIIPEKDYKDIYILQTGHMD